MFYLFRHLYRIITLPLRIISGLFQIALAIGFIALTLIVVGIYWFFIKDTPVADNTTALTQQLAGKSQPVVICMVQHAWDDLSSEARSKITQTGSTDGLSDSALKSILNHLPECSKGSTNG